MGREAGRPYFRRSLSELEALFTNSQTERHVLQALDRELSHRATDRAARLRVEVSNALATCGSNEDANGVVNAGAQRSGTTEPKPMTAPPVAATRTRPPNTTPHVTRAPARETIPPTIDLGELRSVAVPTATNEPTAILGAWTALEALAPQTYRRPEDLAAGDRRCVADLSTGHLPWLEGERSRPQKQIYYQIVLGAIPMDAATSDLVKVFGEQEEQNSRIKEKAAIGALLVDRRGVVVDQNGIAVSSFAWALPLALQRRLEVLGAWSTVEAKLIESVEAIVRRVDREGHPIPVDQSTIDCAHRWLVAQFGLPAHLVDPPTFALRVYHYFKAPNPPDALILNSFFMRDLARAARLVDTNATPGGLKAYLGIDKPAETFDLLTDRTALESALAPAMTPAARWPSPGAHPLVTLQQAAVNLARAELAHCEGTVAVNGPPGTGKTTLLRDVVASCVLDRALAMTAFENPDQAFTASGEKVKVADNAFYQLYALSPTLRGHEVVVASSNNKAVENVSKELPAARAIGWSTNELRYFKSVSDLVYASREARDDETEAARAAERTDTWGMIAAVLGNARNKATFGKSFWWDREYGFRVYLRAAKGDSVVEEVTDPDTGAIERHTPAIVREECPPSPLQAKANWRAARGRLLSLARTVQEELSALEQVRQSCLRISEVTLKIRELETSLEAMTAEHASLDNTRLQHFDNVTSASRQHAHHIRRAHKHQQSGPGFFARIFKTERARLWQAKHAQLAAAELAAARVLRDAERTLSASSTAVERAAKSMHATRARLARTRQQIAKLSAHIDSHRSRLGDKIVDEQFFARGHDVWNLTSPWIPDDLHRKREELFAAALAVHRAFIDAAAQKVLHNLSVLMVAFASGLPGDEAKRRLLGDLWSTLFLVVPVVSTTFASVDRMLGDLPPGSFGWLLIDEAGQALPQAAVGAIMRAKRSIVVGDPLQIPPVVTLPERVTSEICKFFKVETSPWAAPEASAQTLADRASRYRAFFRSDRGPRLAGIPLLVHRRCDEPMFGMSNRIAYDGQMVHAVGTRTASSIGEVLGPSAWFDIDGEADSKWCQAEGEFVCRLLARIARSGITRPDLFIITPFRIVASEMRRRLAQEDRLFAELRLDARTWSLHCVGTIHTVQGREADTVIVLLGAPRASQHGARSWAGSTPNVFNVAVSRAKRSLYVVGSFGAWSGVGYASEVASAMPRLHAKVGEL
jgi:hypothetical protein